MDSFFKTNGIGQFIFRNHPLYASDNKVDNGSFDRSEHFSNTGKNNRVNLCFAENFLKVGGKIFNNNNPLHATIIKLMQHLTWSIQWIGIDDDKACANTGKMAIGYCNKFGIMMATLSPGFKPRE